MNDVVSEVQTAPSPQSPLPPFPAAPRAANLAGRGHRRPAWLLIIATPRWLELEPFLRFMGLFWAPVLGTA